MHAPETVSFWWENVIAVVSFIYVFCHFTTSCYENGVVVKTSPQNSGDLVFLESQKGLHCSYHHSKQLHQVWDGKESRLLATSSE